jgi:glycosyltransferase involved in cell wall biosynthesis
MPSPLKNCSNRLKPSPPLSILLPFRNVASTLDECLDSIQEQSFPDFELLAVDDHSIDESAQIIRLRSSGDHRIRLFRNPGNGLVDALNHGMASISAPLIARMDGDDRMHPERLALQHAFLQQHEEVALVGSRVRLFPEEEIRAGYREYLRWQNSRIEPAEIADDIYVESPFVHPTVMFRKEVILGMGGYRAGLFPEDYDLWLRLFQGGQTMAKLPHTLLDWREDPERLSRIDERCSRDSFDRLRAHYLATDPRMVSGKRDFVIWGAGRKTRKRCRHLLEKGFRPSAWIDIDPNKIGNRLESVPVVSPDWLQREQRPLVLVYVANHGAKELIAKELEEMGYSRGKDYLLVG